MMFVLLAVESFVMRIAYMEDVKDKIKELTHDTTKTVEKQKS